MKKIGKQSEIPEHGDRIIREIAGMEICVINIHGNYHGIANYCPHEGGPICEGNLTGVTTISDDDWTWDYGKHGELLECPWHSWTFDVSNGENVKDGSYSIPTFDIKTQGDDILIKR